MANTKLRKAKEKKNDEFYTQYSDIQKEINAYLEYDENVFKNKTILLPCDDPEWSNFTKFFAQNFERFGLKKLISTSYAYESKKITEPYQLSLFESESPKYDETKTKTHGKIFILENDENKSGKIDIEDLKWDYLEGDGDFRSDEVKKLRDEADIIITNPPFSLFREFVEWIFEGEKDFIILGNENNETDKDIFSLIRESKMWLGKTNGDMAFKVPKTSENRDTRFWIDESGQKWRSFGNMCWFTNIDLGRRHQPLRLMDMADNLKFNKPLIKTLKEKYNVTFYPEFDNYNVIEVPRYDAIPKDYKKAMAVPITFLKYHDPNQFQLLNANDFRKNEAIPKKAHGLIKDKESTINGKATYVRVVIISRGENNENDIKN